MVAIAKLSPGIVRFYFKSKGAMLVASCAFVFGIRSQVLEPVRRCAIRRSLPCSGWSSYLDPVIASTRKVSVWYAFCGKPARQEYREICGQDDRFAAGA